MGVDFKSYICEGFILEKNVFTEEEMDIMINFDMLYVIDGMEYYHEQKSLIGFSLQSADVDTYFKKFN